MRTDVRTNMLQVDDVDRTTEVSSERTREDETNEKNMGQMKQLMRHLKTENISMNKTLLKNLQDWLEEETDV